MNEPIHVCHYSQCNNLIAWRGKSGKYIKYCCAKCKGKGTAEVARETFMARYGVTNPSKSDIIKDRIRNTFTERYGEGVTNSMHVPEFVQAIKDTNMDRYGTETPQTLAWVQEKYKKTSLERYGYERPQQHTTVQEKTRATCMARLGVPYPQQHPKVREKSVDVCMEKYGVANVSQVPEVHDKIMKSVRRRKEYTMPSGRRVVLQGYEPFALDMLLEQYAEELIAVDTDQKPRIEYTASDGITHYYFPDIFIPSENLIIEVKSKWTYESALEVNRLKRDACRAAGYQFQFLVFNEQGELLDTPR